MIVDPAPPRRWLGYSIRVALTLVILFGLISLLGNDRLPEVISRVSFGAFVASMGLNIVASVVLPAVVSYVSAKRTDLRLGLKGLVGINFIVRFYTLILPRASATGVRWLKYRATGTGPAAAALVVLEKLVQIFTYASIAGVLVVVEHRALPGSGSALMSIAALLVIFSGVGLATLFTDKLDPLLARFGFLTRVPLLGRLVAKLVTAVVSQRGRPRRQVASLALWSALGYGFFVASAWVIAQELGIAVSIAALGWIRGLVFLGTLIPITIAGAGIREAGFVGFLSLYDVEQSTALGLALALLGVQIAIGAVGGVAELITTLRSRPAANEGIAVNESPAEASGRG